MVLCLTLILALAACDVNPYKEGHRTGYEDSGSENDQETFENSYAEGYADGFEDGRAAAGTVLEPADSSGPEVPVKPTGTFEWSGFVLVSEAVPDAILEIRYFSTYNFVGERINGYNEPIAILTKEAASALKGASDDLLQQGYQLKIYDAYRP